MLYCIIVLQKRPTDHTMHALRAALTCQLVLVVRGDLHKHAQCDAASAPSLGTQSQQVGTSAATLRANLGHM